MEVNVRIKISIAKAKVGKLFMNEKLNSIRNEKEFFLLTSVDVALFAQSIIITFLVGVGL